MNVKRENIKGTQCAILLILYPPASWLPDIIYFTCDPCRVHLVPPVSPVQEASAGLYLPSHSVLTSRCRAGVLPSLRQPCCVHCPLSSLGSHHVHRVHLSISSCPLYVSTYLETPHVSTSDTRHSLAPRTPAPVLRRPETSR